MTNRYRKLIQQPEVVAGQTWLWGDNYKFYIVKVNDDGTVGCTIQSGKNPPAENCTLEIEYIHRKCRLKNE